MEVTSVRNNSKLSSKLVATAINARSVSLTWATRSTWTLIAILSELKNLSADKSIGKARSCSDTKTTLLNFQMGQGNEPFSGTCASLPFTHTTWRLASDV